MKDLLTFGNAAESKADNQPEMSASIVEVMQRYFRDDRDKMGDLERAIVDSIHRYFNVAG